MEHVYGRNAPWPAPTRCRTLTFPLPARTCTHEKYDVGQMGPKQSNHDTHMYLRPR
jgi:hypothetical protein